MLHELPKVSWQPRVAWVSPVASRTGTHPTLLEMVWPCLGLLPDLAEGLLGFYPDVALTLEDIIAQYLLLGERGEGGGLVWGIHRHKVGEGRGPASQERELASQIVSQAFRTTESQRDTENGEPSPPTQRVTWMPREGQDQV